MYISDEYHPSYGHIDFVMNICNLLSLAVFLPTVTAGYRTSRRYHTYRRHYKLLRYVNIRVCRPFFNVTPYSCRASGRPNCIITRRPDCTRTHTHTHTSLTGVQDKCRFCTPPLDDTHHSLLCHHYKADRSWLLLAALDSSCYFGCI